MFNIWGRKTVRRRLGFAADFCPICRQPQAFEISRLGAAFHLSHIGIGQGRLLGHQRTCLTCGTTLAADLPDYADLERRPQALPRLIRSTFPDLSTVWRDRLDVERRLRIDPSFLDATERHRWLREPFLLMAPRVEQRMSVLHLDAGVGAALFAALLLMGGGPVLVAQVAPAQESLTALGFTLTSAVLVGIQCLTSRRRFMRGQILPALAGALQALRPTEAELAAVLQELRGAGHRLGRLVEPAMLMTHITAHPPTAEATT